MAATSEGPVAIEDLASSEEGGGDQPRAEGLRQRIAKNRAAYLFVAPAVFMVASFMVIPLIYSIMMSFYDWRGFGTPQFSGLENYRRLFNDNNFFAALQNNAIFLVLFTGFTIAIGFAFAVAISRRMWGWQVYKYTFFIPFMLVTAVIAVLWSQIYEPSHGLLNTTLRAVGLERLQQLWLGNPDLTIYSIIVIAIWQLTGWTMILYLAGIEGIDEEIQDAATVDGVTAWQRVRFIIAPLVKRLTFVLIMLQMIAALKTFDLIWVLTGGGPFYASEVLGTILYRTAFEQQQFGYGSAVAVVMTVIVLVVTITFIQLSKIADQES